MHCGGGLNAVTLRIGGRDVLWLDDGHPFQSNLVGPGPSLDDDLIGSSLPVALCKPSLVAQERGLHLLREFYEAKCINGPVKHHPRANLRLILKQVEQYPFTSLWNV